MKIENLEKSFCLHTQARTTIPVLKSFAMDLFPGESVALTGPSGAGKSTVLKLLYGNYKIHNGRILIRHLGTIVNMGLAPARQILEMRKWTIGYVSQFLRVIPRVPCLHIVMEPLLARGVTYDNARERAEALLRRLNIPETLWPLSPTTFSGGEQQRINLARGFIAQYPVMILDEPTASLDPANAQTVMRMIREASLSGTAVIGIFHDAGVRDAVTCRQITLAAPSSA